MIREDRSWRRQPIINNAIALALQCKAPATSSIHGLVCFSFSMLWQHLVLLVRTVQLVDRYKWLPTVYQIKSVWKRIPRRGRGGAKSQQIARRSFGKFGRRKRLAWRWRDAARLNYGNESNTYKSAASDVWQPMAWFRNKPNTSNG